MGSRIAEYESEFIRTLFPHEAQHKHIGNPSESTADSASGNSSAPSSTTSTRSSISEASYNTGMRGVAMPASAVPQLPVSRHQRQANVVEKAKPFKLNNASTNSLQEEYRSASKGDTMVPTNEIQEWAHQVHISQRREYSWCTHCCPEKMEPLQIPSEKAMKRVMFQEPSHAYE